MKDTTIHVPPPASTRPPPPPDPHCAHSWRSAGIIAKYTTQRHLLRDEEAIVVLYCTHCTTIKTKAVKP